MSTLTARHHQGLCKFPCSNEVTEESELKTLDSGDEVNPVYHRDNRGRVSTQLEMVTRNQKCSDCRRLLLVPFRWWRPGPDKVIARQVLGSSFRRQSQWHGCDSWPKILLYVYYMVDFIVLLCCAHGYLMMMEAAALHCRIRRRRIRRRLHRH